MNLLEVIDPLTKITLSTKKIINEGIKHPEDLLFDAGSSGAEQAIDNLAELERNTETVTIKWDGFPALIFGRDSSGKMVIADKHMFDKVDKTTGNRIGMSTSSDAFKAYDTARGADRSDLWDKEKILRTALEKIIPDVRSNRNQFYFGDLLWSGSLESEEGYFTFTPNTVTYKVKQESDLGKRIRNSIGGIAVHTIIPGLGQPDEPIKGLGGLPTNGPIVFLSGEMEEKPTIKVDKSILDNARKIVNRYGPVADSFIESLISMKAKGVLGAMKTFITNKISKGNFDNLREEFLEYLPSKLTSDKSKNNLLGNGNGWLYKDGVDGLNAMWLIWATIVDLKMSIKKQIDAAQSDPNMPVLAFTGDDHGHEGYVIGAGMSKIKLVDRLGFSKANFAKTRTDPKEIAKRARMPMGVFCFGRMNPPTLGHKKLMDIASNLGGGNTFIFLSSKQGVLDDPLDYATKIAFAKTMFPEHSTQIVDDPVLNPIYAANYLYDRGFRNMTFVAGSDRLGTSSGSLETTLLNWNSGPIRSNDHARGPNGREEVILKFESSGDRDPDAIDVSGFSGSKARSAAKNGDEQMFYHVTGANPTMKINGKSLYQAVRNGMDIRETMLESHEHGTIAMLKLSEKSAKELTNWCKSNGVPCISKEDLHCTVLFSRNPVAQLSSLHDAKLLVPARIEGWKKLGSALTLELYAPKAARLHKWMRKQGGTHDYPEYIAHTSVSYEWSDDELPPISPNGMVLEFDRLEIGPIDTKTSVKTTTE